MNTKQSSVEQVTNNATSWIGQHPREKKENGRGQTFVAHTEGDVESIEVYTNIVSTPGNVMMTIHSFDHEQNSWGPALGSSNVEFNKSDSGKWVSFNIPSLHVNKGATYGFRLESQDSYIGVGEAAGSAKHPPFSSGQEWHFNKNDQKGDAFTYFSLAFKIGIKA